MSSTEEDNVLLRQSREVGVRDSEVDAESVVESVIRGEEKVDDSGGNVVSDEASVVGGRDETGEAMPNAAVAKTVRGFGEKDGPEDDVIEADVESCTDTVDSLYACVTWSKTETLVVIVQTLYPRVLRRVKSWLGDSPFSLAVQSSFAGVRCTVPCCHDSSLREVCVVEEDIGAAFCEARVLSLVSTRRGPVAIQSCPSVLFNAYIDWCCSVGRPVPVAAAVFDSDLFRRLVREASLTCLDPFAAVEYLVQRLKKFSHQAWLLDLPRFRLCLESGVVPFESL